MGDACRLCGVGKTERSTEAKRTTINVAWVLGLLASQIAHATSITFELNYEYSGAHPSGPPPWVVIEISDDAAGVKL
jgi:hypothetical protein